MIIGRYTQQPYEEVLREVDYSGWLRENEQIISVTAWCDRITGSATEEVTFEAGGIVVDGSKWQYFVKGGADRSEYKVSFAVQTNMQKREDEIYISVKEI